MSAPTPEGLDPYADWDGAYVLGALPASERRSYEDHLLGCAACRGAVADLAGMPGLLSRLPVDEAVSLLDPPATPSQAGANETTRPAGAPARRTPRTRWLRPRRTPIWLVAAAAVLCALLGGGAAGFWIHGAMTQPPSSYRVAFTDVRPNGMTAVADISPAGSGTAVEVECQYATTGEYGGAAPREYAVYAVGKDGRASPLAHWTSTPGTVMRIPATAQLPPRGIDRLEIRSVGSGRTLLQARLLR